MHRLSMPALIFALIGAPTLCLAEGGAPSTEPTASAVAVGAAPSPAPTAPATSEDRAPRALVGTSTRAWLAAQSSGEQASTAGATLPGPVMRKVHDRYVNSFGVAIPERISTSSRP